MLLTLLQWLLSSPLDNNYVRSLLSLARGLNPAEIAESFYIVCLWHLSIPSCPPLTVVGD